VRRAIADGRLTAASFELRANGHYSIDVDAADREWNAKTDPGRRSASNKNAPVNAELPAVGSVEGDIPDDATLQVAKTQETIWRARLARLKYVQQRGQLVVAADVQREAAELAQLVRDRVLAVPDRISDEVAGMETGREVRSAMRDAIMEALSVLAKKR